MAARRVTEENNQLMITPTNVAVGNVQEEEDDEIDLGALFFKFIEKLHWILLTALIGAAIAGAVVYFLITPIYQATAKIYIVGSDTTISLSDLQIGSNLAADYKEVFTNWHVHEQVKKNLNLDYSIGELSSMVSVTNPTNTHVLYISIKNKNPDEAKELADTYANVAREFIAARMDMREPIVFEKARTPSSPVTPKKTRDIIIGFLAGALLAMAVITIRFFGDDRIRSSEDIEKVGNLAVLGLIPLQDMSGAEQKGNGKRKAARKKLTDGKE